MQGSLIEQYEAEKQRHFYNIELSQPKEGGDMGEIIKGMIAMMDETGAGEALFTFDAGDGYQVTVKVQNKEAVEAEQFRGE